MIDVIYTRYFLSSKSTNEYCYLEEIESNIVTGKTPKTEDIENFGDDIPFITIDDIRGNLFITNTERKLSLKGAETQKNKLIPKNSICVSCIATIGLIGITTEDSQTNQQINSIICENKENFYYLIKALEKYFKTKNTAKVGNIFSNMNKNDFSKIKLKKPNKDDLVKYMNKVEKYYDMIQNNYLENNKLKQLKNYLLPLLINGQINVDDIEI